MPVKLSFGCQEFVFTNHFIYFIDCLLNKGSVNLPVKYRSTDPELGMS